MKKYAGFMATFLSAINVFATRYKIQQYTNPAFLLRDVVFDWDLLIST